MALTHHWSLQEIAGTTAADSVGSNPGTLDASVTFGSPGPGGSLTKAAHFSGSNAPITLASLVTLPGDEDWAIAFWVKQDNNDSRGAICGRRVTTTDFIRLVAANPNVALSLRSNTSTNCDFAFSDATRLLFTHHFLIHDAGADTLSLYLNGVLLEAKPFVGDLAIEEIGNGYPHTTSILSLVGLIADFRVYDAFPSQVDIDAVVALGTGNATESADPHASVWNILSVKPTRRTISTS